MAKRTLTVKNIYDKKHETFKLSGVWKDVFGKPEKNGTWLIWGSEKNGKTWFALLLANYLSKKNKTLYISAEEGFEKAFIESCKRANIDAENKNLRFLEYISIKELDDRLSKRRSQDIIIIDNLTIYTDELKNGVFRSLIKKYNKKLFIFIAHEDRGEPYTATAKLVKRLAKVIIYVKGLACMVSGRVPGGTLMINEEKAKLFHGNKIN